VVKSFKLNWRLLQSITIAFNEEGIKEVKKKRDYLPAGREAPPLVNLPLPIRSSNV